MTDIHSCSYYCERPECIKAQRDELRDRLAQPEQDDNCKHCTDGCPACDAAFVAAAERDRLTQPEQAFDCPRCGHCCSLPDPMPLFDDWGVDWNQCPPCNQKCNQGRDCPNA